MERTGAEITVSDGENRDGENSEEEIRDGEK